MEVIQAFTDNISIVPFSIFEDCSNRPLANIIPAFIMFCTERSVLCAYSPQDQFLFINTNTTKCFDVLSYFKNNYESLIDVYENL